MGGRLFLTVRKTIVGDYNRNELRTRSILQDFPQTQHPVPMVAVPPPSCAGKPAHCLARNNNVGASHPVGTKARAVTVGPNMFPLILPTGIPPIRKPQVPLQGSLDRLVGPTNPK